jgi:nucleotide-binding universal stress UspA family protein
VIVLGAGSTRDRIGRGGFMFHRLLLAIDGSTASRESSAVARQLAERHGSEVVVVHIRTVHYSGVAAWSAQPSPQVEACLNHVQEQMRSDGIAVRQVLADAPHGHVGRAIASIAAEENADLIVMGSTRGSPHEAFPVGSVVTRTLHFAPCPVLIVKDADVPASEVPLGPAA